MRGNLYGLGLDSVALRVGQALHGHVEVDRRHDAIAELLLDQLVVLSGQFSGGRRMSAFGVLAAIEDLGSDVR